jgi:hypothetical protein
MKTAANLLLEYSVLNPETNSLSPSAKSKGVRLVSATAEINHKITSPGKILRLIIGAVISVKLRILKFNITKAKIKARLTS